MAADDLLDQQLTEVNERLATRPRRAALARLRRAIC
jgi:hypothetical protein